MSCPTADVVQAWVEGTLDEHERAAVERHIDECDECRRIGAALAATRDSRPQADTPATVDDAPSSERRRTPAAGMHVGRYQLIEALGRGGMGIVYRARDPLLKRDVALKLLRPDRQGAAGVASERLIREARAMALIAHPNVVPVFDVGRHDDDVYVAMELATGGTLRDWCRKERSVADILATFVAAGRGLAAAHAAELVHRDFKPDNVLVGDDGRVRVTDFGLARSHDAPPETPVPRPGALETLTVSGAVVGTPGYIAPEIYVASPPDARSDQFAFCVALWEALYRQRPFAGTDELDISTQAAGGLIVDPPSDRGVPSRVERALRRGLAPRPEARWPSISVLLAELVPARRRTWLIAALAAGAVAAGITAVALWPRPPAARTAITYRDANDGEDRLLGEIGGLFMASGDAIAKTDLVAARQHADAAMALARSRGTPPIIGEALYTYGMFLNILADRAKAETILLEAIALAEKHDLADLKLSAINMLIDVLELAHKSDQAAPWRAIASAASARATDPSVRAAALERESERLDDVDAARAKLDQAYDLRASGDVGLAISNRMKLAHRLLDSDRNDEAVAVARAAVARVNEQTGNATQVATATKGAYEGAAFVELRARQYKAAEKWARRALEVEGAPSLASMGSADMVLAAALAGQKKLEQAESVFTTALEPYRDQPAALAMVTITYAAQLRDMDLVALALRHAENALTTCERELPPEHAVTTTARLVVAKLAWRTKPARAKLLAEQTIATLEKQDAPDKTSIADARFVIARTLPDGERARARALAESALADFRAHHAHAKAEDVTEWLAKH